MKRINISLHDPDDTLEAAQDQIVGEELVRGAFESTRNATHVKGVLEVVQAQQNAGPLQLDLIAHSRDSELVLGMWTISAAETLMDDILAAVPNGTSIQEVRLLGCFTALSPNGRAAMQHLKSLGIPKVFGTMNLLAARHFDNNGLKSNALVIEFDNLPTPPPPAPIPTPGNLPLNLATGFGQMNQIPQLPWASSLRAETMADARVAVDKYVVGANASWTLRSPHISHPNLNTLLPPGTMAREEPGLLLLPDAEYLYPVPNSPGKFHRVTVLLRGRLLRIYTPQHPKGIIVRPAAPIPF